MTETKRLWSKRIKAWEQSGISQKKYCTQNSISFPAFQYWRKKVSPEEKKFFELNTSRETREEPAIIIALQNGIHIKVNRFENVSIITALISELKDLS